MIEEFNTLKKVQRRVRDMGTMVEVHEYLENELARLSGGRAPHPKTHTGTGWVVTQDCRSGQVLFLIDRGRCRDRWWTPELAMAIEFDAQHIAEKKAETYVKNNVRVLSYAEARIADLRNRDLERAAEFAGTTIQHQPAFAH